MELRDPAQVEKAKLEDTLMEILYSKYVNLVFHGGTAIWRCYSGNRFSRDLDFYMEAKTSAEKMQEYRAVSKFLQENGFAVKEKGYSKTNDTMHFVVELAGTKMKIDINFKYKKGIHADYSKIDGSRMVVLSLSPEELLNEKITAYNDKLDNEGGFKHPEAHDLYDMWYLTSLIKKADSKTVKRLRELIARIENKPPADISSLDHMIITGLPPSFGFMVKRLKEWVDDNSQ
jgi:predicted nucleotidyltransferase component of viral defense system